MALKKVKGNFDRIFDKNMTDLVRGIRNNKDTEAKYIAQCMEEIKIELKQDNIAVKANAVTKLAYLQMLGYDISWAGFNIIEVMSSAKFTHKRIGYLSASQCFNADQEILMLTTNMIRKDLNSQNQYEAGNALSALACFVSPDLARDLSNDILTLLTSTKPYLRKKGVLMLYKIFLKYPDALRPAFPRLKEKLEDPDPGVQSAAVNVICELARKNPKNYLSLAPIFFRLMTTSTNNWMLIKIIKLFGALTPLEPRLGKKLIEPLTNLIHSTSAMSLLYECINTTIAGMPNHSSSIHLCVQKLRILIEDSDQNLKYLGLLAMSKILPTHPKSVQTHKDLVMRCLDDKDDSIRLRALDLLYGMVNKKNLMEIVKKLLVHMEKAEGTTYRDELLSKIIQICSQNNYQHITNFEWYVSVLVELTRVEGLSHGDLVASQMLDVAIRVHAIRPFAVQQMSLLLENPFVIFGLSGGGGMSRTPSMTQVLYAAAWICGEYVKFLPNPRTTLMAMLDSRVAQLPHNIQAVYLQNCLKILAHLLCHPNEEGLLSSDEQLSADVAKEMENGDLMSEGNLIDDGPRDGEGDGVEDVLTKDPALPGSGDYEEFNSNEEIVLQNNNSKASTNPNPNPAPKKVYGSGTSADCVNLSEIQDKLKPFVSSEELEVQERASTLFNVIKCYLKLEGKGDWDMVSLGSELSSFFAGDLNPVAPKAQKKVPVPEGLDLDAWINDPPSESDEDSDLRETSTANVFVNSSLSGSVSTSDFYGTSKAEAKKTYQPTDEELSRQRDARRLEQDLNPHYLKSSGKNHQPPSPMKRSGTATSLDSEDIPPIAKLDLNVPLKIPGLASSDKYLAEANAAARAAAAAQKQSKSKSKKAKKDKKKGKKRRGDEEEDEGREGGASVSPEPDVHSFEALHVVNTVIEMPEGATLSDNEDSNLPEDDPHRALNVDLDIPLEASETLPVPTHRTVKSRNPHYLQHTNDPAPINNNNDGDATNNHSRKPTESNGTTKHKKSSKTSSSKDKEEKIKSSKKSKSKSKSQPEQEHESDDPLTVNKIETTLPQEPSTKKKHGSSSSKSKSSSEDKDKTSSSSRSKSSTKDKEKDSEKKKKSSSKSRAKKLAEVNLLLDAFEEVEEGK